MMRSDVLVVGSGAAGLLLALHCAEQGLAVTIATKGTIEESNTAWAQGGVAASLDLEEDSAAAHLADTLAAGAGLCNEAAAALVAAEAPQRIEELRGMGVAFNIAVGGALALTREAAHSHARTVFSGDATGRAISTTLAQKALHHPNVRVIERSSAVSLIVREGRCCGAWLLADEEMLAQFAGATALATGGIGQAYARTTNPAGATGDGLLLALDAGAALADVEFVQFHPTALAIEGAPALLVSEAARGEGGILVNDAGERFCFAVDPRGELAPRDVVARAIFHELARKPQDHVWLDLRPVAAPSNVRRRFPNIAAACARFGVDIGSELIPVAPAAHYHMGGIATDLHGRTSLSGLYAVGECACTGLHGANRLAGNSLAECLVMAGRAADDIAAAPHLEGRSGAANGGAGTHAKPPARIDAMSEVDRLRACMWQGVSVERDGPSLISLARQLDEWPRATQPVSRSVLESAALLNVARYITDAALIREESRGAHFRVDFPQRDDQHWRARVVWTSSGHAMEPINATVAR
ncbi:MAG: L-aspartate oxidase [Candidatus Eremiobacter antarcticus]|nr:L-aspartate oxidase [Candidatus Eremiobacteraeota bacterium]MBC5807484.1 L-aspartate oxidase [Candidatus Eremiobacteraeota bacterium]PZR61457.1 MAG: L-aspartate oxidase [Candidatus Eremiobacter sp. RRmetagenome_bin22]